eukprot:954202_1
MPTNRETTNSDGNDNTDDTHDGSNRNGHNHGNGTNGHNHDGGDDRKGNDHEDDEFAQDEPHHRCNHLQECSDCVKQFTRKCEQIKLQQSLLETLQQQLMNQMKYY